MRPTNLVSALRATGVILAVVVAACGAPVDSVVGTAGDDTAEVSPAPTVTPTQPATRPSQTYAQYRNPMLGWSVEYPAIWHVKDWQGVAAAFTSYDPATAPFEQKATFESASAIPPPTELRVNVEVWPNEVGATLTQYVDAWLAAAPTQSHARITSRTSGMAAGLPAEVVTLTEATQFGDRNAVYVFFGRPGSGRMFLIRAYPAESVYRGELDRMLTTIRIP